MTYAFVVLLYSINFVVAYERRTKGVLNSSAIDIAELKYRQQSQQYG